MKENEIFTEANAKFMELERQRNNALTDCTQYAAENAKLIKKIELLEKENKEMKALLKYEDEE